MNEFHVHVGAGKLGLSLIVPSLVSSGVPLAIVDTPKDPSWTPLLDSGAAGVTLVVNDKEVCSLSIAGAPPRLAVTDDTEALQALVARATTLSCSLGPWMAPTMTRLLGLLPETGRKPVLYCCENDHAAVAALAEALKHRATVVDCMVDRISTERVVDASNGEVRVTAEAWPGTIASLDPLVNRARAPPFAGGHGAAVYAPLAVEEARFLADRKLRLVNGMHTTLAFMSLRDRHALEPGTIPLLKPGAASPAEAEEIWRWALARCANLVRAHGVEAVRAADALDSEAAAFDALTAFARNALARFDGADDTVARVLGGGVAKRWHGRLASALEGLDEALPDPAVGRFLAHAKADGAELKRVLASLVADTCAAHEHDEELHPETRHEHPASCYHE